MPESPRSSRRPAGQAPKAQKPQKPQKTPKAPKARRSPGSRKRHRTLAWIAAGAMATAVALLVVAVIIIVRRPSPPPEAAPPEAVPPTSAVPAPGRKPRPASQPADCPDVQLVSVPGTWESAVDDDPFNPTFNPAALLLTVTRPIAEQFGADRVQTYTVPYIAQFKNPLAADNQVSYNQSRDAGTAATVRAMSEMNEHCPLTSYVLIGFSQGAVIAGDIAGDIGNGRGPVDEDLVLGVTLIADGRRQDGVGVNVPPSPPGQGAEVTLHELPLLSGIGITMTGAREGGFGALADRVNEICAVGDLICAAPQEAFSPTKLPVTLQTLAGGAAHPVHAMYGTPDFWNADGEPATVWTLNWARQLIEDAPHPPHG